MNEMLPDYYVESDYAIESATLHGTKTLDYNIVLTTMIYVLNSNGCLKF